MKITNPNLSKNCVEIEISTNELEMLETALSFARRSLNETEIKKFFGENFELEDLIADVRIALQDFEKYQPVLAPKEQLKKFVAKFKKWISDNYSEEQIKENLIDDAGYANWDEVENCFKEILKNNQFSSLDNEDKINLLYLIARNWDIGNMISWFSAERPLSNLGDLADADFIDLAKIVAGLPNFEFEEAKFQFASSFKKFEELTPEIEEILLKIHQTGEEYSSRHALKALAKLGFKDIRDLIKKSWETEEDEFYKIDCLESIKYIGDENLLKEYLDKASSDNREEISEYLKRIIAEEKII